MSEEKPAHKNLVSVALFKFSDATAWQLAFEILDAAGILIVSEGGLGVVEICVEANQADLASALLRKEPRLNGKIFSADELRARPG